MPFSLPSPGSASIKHLLAFLVSSALISLHVNTMSQLFWWWGNGWHKRLGLCVWCFPSAPHWLLVSLCCSMTPPQAMVLQGWVLSVGYNPSPSDLLLFLKYIWAEVPQLPWPGNGLVRSKLLPPPSELATSSTRQLTPSCHTGHSCSTCYQNPAT